jgi:hypothetical protein
MGEGMGGGRRSDVRRYYDANTWKFLLTGSQRAIHRELWGPGVTNRSEALHHAHALVLDELGPDDRRVHERHPAGRQLLHPRRHPLVHTHLLRSAAGGCPAWLPTPGTA